MTPPLHALLSPWRGALAGLSLVLASAAFGAQDTIPLAGTWRFRLDADKKGVDAKWFAEELEDTVTLPGTTETNEKGPVREDAAVDRLSRPRYWVGPAWFQRDVEIPAGWRGKRITLLVERTKHTQLWVDDTPCGTQDSLSAPHVFDLTQMLPPGHHTLTLLVDNSKLPPVGASHAVDERTQSNWNGMLGRIELRATDPVWLEDVQIYPDVASRRVRVRALIGNNTGHPVTGRIEISCASFNVTNPIAFPSHTFEVRVPERRNVVEDGYAMGDEAPLWDEFRPALLRMNATLNADGWSDRREAEFGLRDFRREGQRLTINGRTVFLRGRIDCANYPLTGHAPMDKAEWLRVLGIVRNWGLNHVRFHSWCPPEAAFAAADELGMYLQPELPNKRSAFKAPESADAAVWNADYLEVPPAADGVSLYEYAIQETERIMRNYGNHPSFVMYTLGNELGRNPAMFELVKRFRERDPRRLYAQGSNNQHWAPAFADGDDFWVTGKTGKDLPVRGAFFAADFPDGHLEHRPPSTRVDYRVSIRDVPAPVVAHEIGQYEVTPDFSEIPKYTGPLKARNLEVFRQRLQEAHMLDLAPDFMRASGALAAICQREEIEAALRTPGLGGFHWLDLQDFPGQGTALVGLLNVFMESKGIVAPEIWRQCCCETVPLCQFDKYTWTADETFSADVKIAHYGPSDLSGARVLWTLTRPDGSAVGAGAFGPLTIQQGAVFPVGTIQTPLAQASVPAKIELTVTIAGTPYLNRYEIWVYPPHIDLTPAPGVFVTHRLDAAALKRLEVGGRVLLFPPGGTLTNAVEGAFTTDFWSWPMFARAALQQKRTPPPGTQGFLCDPRHPALADFPTEFHSNWQWWQIVKNARPIILDDTPAEYRPIIHVIDNFARNHKLGLLFETRVGQGRLLVCASDLPKLVQHPEARQLLHSLLRYVDSAAFAPTLEMDPNLLLRFLPGDAASIPAKPSE